MSGKSIIIGSVLLLAGLAVLLRWNAQRPSEEKPKQALVLYCAANLTKPITEAAKQFETEQDIAIQLSFGGSGTLLNNLQVDPSGDLYLAADASYIALGREKGLLDETIPLARQTPVIAVAKGNPKQIRAIDDLLRKDVKVVLANTEASVGKLGKKILSGLGKWKELEQHVTATGVFKPTVMDVANDLKIGALDAGIVWDSTVAQFPELEAVHVEIFDRHVEEASVAILKRSKFPNAALRFARYLQAPEKGGAILKKQGFVTVDGDAWSVQPELTLFSGAMLRPAIEETIKEFEAREGVTVNRVYEGCGSLVSQMKAGGKPDAFFACDRSFYEMVNDRFAKGEVISSNQVVILVPKGNPKELKTLKDLLRPDLKIALGHPEKSALGVLTVGLFKQEGLHEKLQAASDRIVHASKGDDLVNMMKVGSRDAALVYVSNAALVRDQCDLIPVDIPQAIAVQPYGVANDSRYKHLMNRLLDRIHGVESRKRFEALGFAWKAEDGVAKEGGGGK